MNAFLLVLVVAAVAATVAHANPCDLNGKTKLPIGSADDFLKYQTGLFRTTTYVVLTADIDFSQNGQVSFPLGGQGSSCTPFVGVFDGNGHKISGIVVNTTENTENLDGAFFCRLQGACVRNVVFDETCKFVGSNVAALALDMNGDSVVANVTSKAYVEGTHYAGGLIAQGDFMQTGSGEFDSCTVSGTVKSATTAGGLIATASGSSDAKLTFSNCQSTGLVQTQLNAAGGFLGELTGTSNFNVEISGSTRSGVINATDATRVGGFIGSISNIRNANVAITDSVHDGTVSAVYGPESIGYVGGFVGSVDTAEDAGVIISRSTNNGDVTVQNDFFTYVGGFVGNCINLNNFRAHFDFCTNNGNITVPNAGSNANVGGLAGAFSLGSQNQNSVTVSNCENSGTVSSSPNGVACGFFAALGFTEGLYTGEVYNSVNKGRIVGTQAFGVANDVTSARLVVSMGSVEGSYKARMFWNNVTTPTASHLYVLFDSNRTDNEKATVFLQSPINMRYFPAANTEGSSLETILQDVVTQDARNGGRWTSNLGMTSTPAVVSVRVFFDEDAKKSSKSTDPISTLTWIVKSGEALGTVKYLESFLTNDKCVVIVKENNKKVAVYADSVIPSDTTVDVEKATLILFDAYPPSSHNVNASFVIRDEPEYTEESVREELQQLFPMVPHVIPTKDTNRPGHFAVQFSVIDDDADGIKETLLDCAHPDSESIF